MSAFVMFTQVVLPLLLLAWIALFPAAGWLALALQFISVAAILSGLALAALWTVPPFWVPCVYAFLATIVMGWHLWSGRLRIHGGWRTPALNTVLILFSSVPGLLGGYLSYQAVQGRIWPEGTVVDIAAPFSGALSDCTWRRDGNRQRSPQNTEQHCRALQVLARPEQSAGHFSHHSTGVTQGRLAPRGPIPIHNLWYRGSDALFRPRCTACESCRGHAAGGGQTTVADYQRSVSGAQ